MNTASEVLTILQLGIFFIIGWVVGMLMGIAIYWFFSRNKP